MMMGMQQMPSSYYVAAIRDVTRTISEKTQVCSVSLCPCVRHGGGLNAVAFLGKVLGKMLQMSMDRLHAAQQTAQESIFLQTPLVVELDRVFAQLQGIAVDPSMVSGERGKTLFDFVDAETVHSLQQDAVEQMNELEELFATHEHALTRISSIYKYFRSFEAKNVKSSSNRLEDAHSLEKRYEAAVSFFVNMEQCDRFLLRYFTTINDIYPHYEAIFADAPTLFDELRSLRDFYHHFLASYLKLEPELQRRQAYEQETNRIIQEATARLAACEEQESKVRVQFCQDHARFLPASLCPEIRHLPDQFKIVRIEDEETSVDGPRDSNASA